MGREEQKRFEEILMEEISKLRQADQQAIREAMGIDTLSAEAVTRFIKTTSAAAIAQMIISSFGFGGFLFLTTIIHAFGLLLGVTFAFNIYAFATSLLSFLLSGPFLFIFAVASGGLLFWNSSKAIDDEIAKLFVLIGRSKLLNQTSEG